MARNVRNGTGDSVSHLAAVDELLRGFCRSRVYDPTLCVVFLCGPHSLLATSQDLKDCDRRERPDVLWDRGDRIVILEVDEDQNRERPCECEQTRICQISCA